MPHQARCCVRISPVTLLHVVLGLLILSTLATGCFDHEHQTEQRRPVTVADAMGGPPPEGFARVTEPKLLLFPRDHGPHPDYATEWWYFTGNLFTQNKRRFGYQLTLFRVGLQHPASDTDNQWRTDTIYMGHLAVSDVTAVTHHGRERFARAAAGLAGAQATPLAVWLDHWQILGQGDPFPLRLQAQEGGIAIDLLVEAGDRPMVLQGENGFSQKGFEPGNESYYYSYTRLPTRGSITIDGERYKLEGNSWFDREWSTSALEDDQVGWDWFALQLDDGRDIMLYQLRTKNGAPHAQSAGIILYPDGQLRHLSQPDFIAVPLDYWTSADGFRYPVSWRVSIKSESLTFDVNAVFPDQVMDLTVSYWEGAVDVSQGASGIGYLEMSGYSGGGGRIR